jgi:NAD(P)-dependent dehydrogenase (short-subunit alcohol dehydrogenase family)
MSEERAALVTGAGRGIGRAVAQRLVDDGLDVLSVDLEPDGDGPGVPHAADLATREGNRGAVDAALERFGRLDVAFANAGFGATPGFAGEAPEHQKAMVLTNVLGVVYTIRLAMEPLSATRGHLVVTGSVAGRSSRTSSRWPLTSAGCSRSAPWRRAAIIGRAIFSLGCQPIGWSLWEFDPPAVRPHSGRTPGFS